jgi:hypothetical protein
MVIPKDKRFVIDEFAAATQRAVIFAVHHRKAHLRAGEPDARILHR